jgi:hypothetical protein
MSYVAVMLLLYPFWPFLASFFVMLATLDIRSQNRRPVPRLSASLLHCRHKEIHEQNFENRQTSTS